MRYSQTSRLRMGTTTLCSKQKTVQIHGGKVEDLTRLFPGGKKLLPGGFVCIVKIFLLSQCFSSVET